MELDQQRIQNTAANADVLITMLERQRLKYKVLEQTDERTRIRLHFTGSDLPITIYVILRTDRQIASVFSALPITVPEEKRSEIALAVAAANHGLIDGSFDYNTETGEIRFRLTSCYIESVLSEALFTYLMFVSAETIDRFNDRFAALSEGSMTLDEFLAADAADVRSAQAEG